MKLTGFGSLQLSISKSWTKENGLAEQQVTKKDFVLDGFGAELDRMVHELEYGRGFVLMRGFPVDRYDYADIRRIYWGIG